MQPRLPSLLASAALVCGAPAQAPRHVLALPAPPLVAGPLPDSTAAVPCHPRQRLAYVEALQKRATAERYSLAAAAAALGAGPGPAFQLVRDRFRFESYPGILRGAELCFAARAGNALDRSLVLIELLRDKKIEARLVRGKLPRERAEELVERLFAPDLAPARPAPSGDLQRSTLSERIAARARRDYAVVRQALGEALPSAALPSRDDLVREVEQHFWVQARQGQDWVDLDSAFAGATVGESFTDVEQVYAKVPAELHQQVILRVITETVANGRLDEEIVLEVKTTAAEVAGEQVLLLHAPESAARGLGAAIAGRAPRWVPVLLLGSDAHSGQPIDFGLPGRGGVTDVLAAEPAESAPSPFVAESLEIEIVLPDGRTDVSRRALVDRGGPAWRAAGHCDIGKLKAVECDERGPLAASAVHNLLFSSGQHDVHGYVASLALYARSLLADHEAQQSAGAEAASPPVAEADDDPLLALWPFYLQNLGWLVWSDHALVPALNDLEGLRFYCDSPRAWIATLSLAGDDVRVMLDLRRDKLRAVARDPAASGRATAERKLWFALVEGALEHEALAERGAGLLGNELEVATTSARLGQQGVVVVRTGDGAPIDELVGRDAEKAAWLRLALERDSVVVAPKQALSLGDVAWWELHRRGDARAVFGQDWNGALLLGAGYYRNQAKSSIGGSGYNRNGGGSFRPKGPGGGRTGPRTARGGGGGELGEYVTILLTITVPNAYAYFAIGLGVEVTALFVGAAILGEQ